jgi:hypothetical protein
MTTSFTKGDDTHLPGPSLDVNFVRINLWLLGTRRSRLPHPCDQEADDD